MLTASFLKSRNAVAPNFRHISRLASPLSTAMTRYPRLAAICTPLQGKFCYAHSPLSGRDLTDVQVRLQPQAIPANRLFEALLSQWQNTRSSQLYRNASGPKGAASVLQDGLTAEKRRGNLRLHTVWNPSDVFCGSDDIFCSLSII